MRAFAVLLFAAVLQASEVYPVPEFADPERAEKLSRAFPEIDTVMRRYMEQVHAPGVIYGVVVDGRLAHLQSFGVRDIERNAPVTPDSVFRIASMTKSFTALAMLKLRDEGKLSLDDPVSKWIPEFDKSTYPTRDTAPVRLRQLLTHGVGLPEDNPWGDQQLAASDSTLEQWLLKGVPFSTAPDTRYEYSNYGFALAGRVIAKAAGRPYREYVQAEILAPLGMEDSTFEPSEVPEDRRAVGYRRLPTGKYEVEPALPHGSFGAMGGLLTPAKDLAKYVAFMLSAWPPRDDPESGPVRRSSVREMQRVWRTNEFSADRTGPNGTLAIRAGGYGYGLAVSQDCHFRHSVGHAGGLPGFGSYMVWLPEHGVGLFAMANITYAGPAPALREALEKLRNTGALEPRQLSPSPVLRSTRDAIVRLWNNWSEREAQALAADNLFKDTPMDQRRRDVEELRKMAGECGAPTSLIAENWLRASFRMPCDNGAVEVAFTLAPTNPPLVQHLRFTPALNLRESMRKTASELAANARTPLNKCKLGRVISSDGKQQANIQLDCEHGTALLDFELSDGGDVKRFEIRKAPGSACGI